MTMNPIELLSHEVAMLPKDITGAAQVGDYISLKNYTVCVVTLQQGAWAGGTPAVTLTQSTDVAASGEKALGFDARWTKVGVTGTTFVKTVVASDTFNLPNVANTINKIFVRAEDLDTDNGFDVLCVKVASPGANADLLEVHYDLFGARYPQAVMIDAKVD